MSEIRRVLCSQSFLMLVGILVLLHAIFFFYQCNDSKQNTLTDLELEDYLSGYPEYVQSVCDNADTMLENPLFSDHDSFVYRNIVKTRSDYAKLRQVHPLMGENRGVVTLLNYSMTNIFLLLIGVYLVLTFLAERKKGLYLLVRCTCNGRFPLTLQRVLALIPGIAVPGVLLFSSAFLISLLVFPGADLSRPIQSIPEFSGVVLQTSVGGYLCLFLLQKLLGCIVLCLLLFFCMSLLRSSLCMLLFGALFFAEYLLYALLIPTARLSALKYLNLFTMLFHGTDYGNYYNLNLFGRPVPTAAGVSVMALILLFALSLLCLIRYTTQYPKAETHTLPFAEKLSVFLSKKKPQLTPFFWEGHKLLFSQKALLILAGMILLVWTSSRESNYTDFRSKYITQWYQTYSGQIDQKMLRSMQKKIDYFEGKIERMEACILRNLEVMSRMAPGDRWYLESLNKDYERLIKEMTMDCSGLKIVRTRAASCLEWSENTHLPVMLIDTTCYDLLLEMDQKTVRRNYLYNLLSMILMLSGIMAWERTSHMETMLHTLYLGRRKILFRKIVLVFLLSVPSAMLIHGVQFVQIGQIFPYHSPTAYLQSISCMQFVLIPMTIRTGLILLYTLRALLSFAMGLAVMVISNYSKSRMTTIALSVFLLVIPVTLLSFAGLF